MKPITRRKPGAEEIGELYQELAYLSELDTPRDKLVSTLQEEVADSALGKSLYQLVDDQAKGSTLGAAIARFTREKNRFSELLIDATSEPSDTAMVFNILASLRRRETSMTGLILSLPSLVALGVIFVIVLGILLIKVVPQFAETFASFGAELPALTQLALEVSGWVVSWWWVAVLVVAGIAFSYRNSKRFKVLTDRFLLILPRLGQHTRDSDINEFLHRFLLLRELDCLSEVQALQFSREGVGNAYLENMLEFGNEEARLEVLVNTGTLFPQRVGRLLARARSEAELYENLRRYVEVTAERLITRGIRNSQILDIIIKLVFFSTIGLVLVALYLPIFMLGSVI